MSPKNKNRRKSRRKLGKKKGQKPKKISTKEPSHPKLRENRDRIDQLDEQIVSLLNQRAKMALEIGRIKEDLKLRIHVPERERQIYKRLEKINEKLQGNFPTPSVHRVFREIISASLSLEKPLRVGYLGPKATFTHLATMEHFGLSTDAVPLRSIPEVFSEVERGQLDYGVVPIENSTEGMVNHTLDLFVDSKLKIIAEQTLEVDHHLLMKKKQPLSKIQTVASHQQALSQCRIFLDKHLPGIPVIETDSTAKAAQMALDNERVAAIASGFAAELYDLEICKERIQDHLHNFTRFLILGRENIEPSGHDKTSLLFAVKDEPGILYRMLKPFAKGDVNLTKIESRPLKTKPWNYVFFIDLDGHFQDPKVAQAIEELEKICSFFKILGSYPKSIIDEKPFKGKNTK